MISSQIDGAYRYTYTLLGRSLILLVVSTWRGDEEGGWWKYVRHETMNRVYPLA